MSLGRGEIVTRTAICGALDFFPEQARDACAAKDRMEQAMKTTELIKLCIAIATVMVGVTAYTLLIAVQAVAA
jgi:hypothetical protein